MNKNASKSAEHTSVFGEISDEELDRELDELIATLNSDVPSYETTDGIKYEDASDRFPEDADVIRVELRRCAEGVDKIKDLTQQKVKDEYIIGLLMEDEFPQEGEMFQIYYHSENDELSELGDIPLGHVHSHTPVVNVVQEGENYFFSSGKINWRLRIIDCGN